MHRLTVLVSGILFGAGVTLAGMTNPMKVMGAGLIVTLIGYRIAFSQAVPLHAPAFDMPSKAAIDARLIGGSALFGLGWGLTGFCPGPAIASLIFGHIESVIFVVAMSVGMIGTKLGLSSLRTASQT
jgi:uncharacterized protein